MSEADGQAWYERTAEAIRAASGLGAVSSWRSRVVPAGSPTAKRRVAAVLAAARRMVKAGKMTPGRFRRLRASLDEALFPFAGGGAASGESGGGGGPGGGGLPPSSVVAASSLPESSPTVTGVQSVSAAASQTVGGGGAEQ